MSVPWALREEPLMIGGGARAKAGKNSTATRLGKKSSAGWPGKKTQHDSLPEAPPDY